MLRFNKGDNTVYFEQINLLASKVIWLQNNQDLNVLLLVCLEKQKRNSFCEDIYHALAQNGKKVSLNYLNANDQINNLIDWDHDLNILYLDSINTNSHLAQIAEFADLALILPKSSITRRTDITKAVKILKSFNIKIGGTVLTNFKEKVPALLKRIFF
ncbi:MAG: hypothetical protein MK132_19955 [Lentisphaerales bacterium]|nr:hypothetical protein [Lentisphaerales bacterium]